MEFGEFQCILHFAEWCCAIYGQLPLSVLEGSEAAVNAHVHTLLHIIFINITMNIIILMIIMMSPFIIIARPKPAYDRQGLAGGSLCASGAQLASGNWEVMILC